jgi:hypothetical protein
VVHTGELVDAYDELTHEAGIVRGGLELEKWSRHHLDQTPYITRRELVEQLDPTPLDPGYATFDDRLVEAFLGAEVVLDRRGVGVARLARDLSQRHVVDALGREQAFRGHQELLTGPIRATHTTVVVS